MKRCFYDSRPSIKWQATFPKLIIHPSDFKREGIKNLIIISKERKVLKMSGSDTALLNQAYKNIERPYANVDLSKIPSWDLVMSIMEQQAMEARRQIMARYQESQQQMPTTIEYQYYSNNSNQIESDNSSFCSDEMDSSPTTSSDSDMSIQSDSDIEIDVDSIEENDDYFLPSLDNIPITVLHLETKLREKELKGSS